MNQKKITLVFEGQDETKSFKLDDGPLLLGSSDQCQIIFGTKNPVIKATIQYFTDYDKKRKVLFSSLDPQLKFHYKDLALNQIILEKDQIINIVIDKICITNEDYLNKTEGVPPLMPPLPISNHKEPAKENITTETKKSSPEQNFTEQTKDKVSLPSPAVNKNLSEDHQKNIEQKNHQINELLESIPSGSPKLINGTFHFSTVFDEDSFRPKFELPFLKHHFDFTNYIDPEDETVTKLPDVDITKENLGKSIQITHMNNGTILNEKYFPLELKRIFLTRGRGNKRSFQIYDLDEDKVEFIYIKDNRIYIDSIDHYYFQKFDLNEGVTDIETRSTELKFDDDNQRIVYTKGSSQIIVRVTNAPPELRPVDIFNVNELLTKCVASSWAVASVFFLLIMLFVNIDIEEKKPKKEVIIIYKRKKPIPTPVKKPVKASEEVKVVEVLDKKKSPPKAPSQKANTDKVKKTVKVDKLPKSDKPKVTSTKHKEQKNIKKVIKDKKVVSKNMKKVMRKKSKKIGKSNPVKKKIKVAKSYSFNTSSMMKTALTKPSSSIDSVDKVDSSFNQIIGKNKYKMEKGIKKLGVTRNKINRLGSGDVKGLKTSFGVQDISSKKGTRTSYQRLTTKILGAVDPELIRKILREYIPHFRLCYQNDLFHNPELKGIFDLDFQITPQGRGTNLKISKSKVKFSKKGMDCLRKVVAKIKFPKPRGGGTVDIVQPLNFYSKIK